jgi:hypothetical protein
LLPGAKVEISTLAQQNSAAGGASVEAAQED